MRFSFLRIIRFPLIGCVALGLSACTDSGQSGNSDGKDSLYVKVEISSQTGGNVGSDGRLTIDASGAPISESGNIGTRWDYMAKSEYSLKPDIIGYFLTTDYLNDLITTGSPRAVQTSHDIIGINIQKEEETEMMVHNFHEGLPVREVIPWKEGSALVIGDDRLVNHRLYVSEDGYLEVRGLNASFYAVRHISEDEMGQPDWTGLVNEALFSSGFELNGQAVEFHTDGKVTGLPKIQGYEVVTDYFGVGMDMDQLIITSGKLEGERVGFSLQGIELDIFELKCEEADPNDPEFCWKHTRGKTLYSLKRRGVPRKPWKPATE